MLIKIDARSIIQVFVQSSITKFQQIEPSLVLIEISLFSFESSCFTDRIPTLTLPPIGFIDINPSPIQNNETNRRIVARDGATAVLVNNNQADWFKGVLLNLRYLFFPAYG